MQKGELVNMQTEMMRFWSWILITVYCNVV